MDLVLGQDACVCFSGDTRQNPNSSCLILFPKTTSEHICITAAACDRGINQDSYQLWMRTLLRFLSGKIGFLNPHQSQSAPKMRQSRMQRTSGSVTKHNLLFSDRKTRLRWHHLSRCNKAPCRASDRLEAHNKEWQSWRECASLIPAKIWKIRYLNDKHELISSECFEALLVAEAAVFQLSRL